MKTVLLVVLSSALMMVGLSAKAYQGNDLQECFELCRQMYPENGAARAACKQRCIFYGEGRTAASLGKVSVPTSDKGPRDAAR